MGTDQVRKEEQGSGMNMEGALAASSNAQSYLGNVKDRAEKEEQAKETAELQYNSKGDKMQVTGASKTIMEHLEKSKAFDEIQNIWAKQQAEKQAQIEKIRAHPFANALSQIAASMAKNDPNPYTRGLGEAAERLNPTIQQLQGEQRDALHGQTQALQAQGTLDAKLAHILATEERIAISDKLAKSRVETDEWKGAYLRAQARKDDATAAAIPAKVAETGRHHLETEKRDAEKEKRLGEHGKTMEGVAQFNARSRRISAEASSSRAATAKDVAGKPKGAQRTVHQIEGEINNARKLIERARLGTAFSLDPEGEKRTIAEAEANIARLEKERDNFGRSTGTSTKEYKFN